MWTRAELKMRAKANLRRYYGAALFVSFIANLFASGSSGSGGGAGAGAGGAAGGAAGGVNAGVGAAGDFSIPVEGLEDIMADVPGAVDRVISQIDPVGMSIVASILVAVLAISLAIGIFAAPIFEVGKNRFYMESRELGFSSGIQNLIWGFSHEYLNIVWTMFLKNLLVFLGTFCCVIPGIYLGYCYYMVPYILAENPDIKATDALRMSKAMMADQKLNTFILEISFWGWWILGSLMCGIGGVLIQPYFDATIAELYAVLRQRFQGRLNGFENADAYDDCYRNRGYADVTQQQYVSPSERNEFTGAGEEQASQRDAESIGGTDRGCQQGAESGAWSGEQNSSVVSEYRETEVSSSESGTRRGYYLNGVFYPYTEEELRELEKNKHKN